MDSPQYRLIGRLAATVNTMERNNGNPDAIKEGRRLESELKKSHEKAQEKMESRRRMLPVEGRRGQPLEKWVEDEDYKQKVKTVDDFIEKHRPRLIESHDGGKRKRRGKRGGMDSMESDDEIDFNQDQVVPVDVEPEVDVESYRDDLDVVFNDERLPQDIRFQAEEFNQLEDDEMMAQAEDIESFIELYQQFLAAQRGVAEGKNRRRTKKNKNKKRKTKKNKNKKRKTKGNKKNKKSKTRRVK